jgi:hypothetical protein
MAKRKNPSQNTAASSRQTPKRWRLMLLVAAAAAVLGFIFLLRGPRLSNPPDRTAERDPGANNKNAGAQSAPPPERKEGNSGGSSELQTMEVNHAVMVTVELDFGPRVPTIGEALKEVERRYLPDDGIGRTFAILDAYGEPTPDGKLHMSMHVSSEKTGRGSLVFRRTSEVLWQSRIVGTTSAQARALTILIDNGRGGTFTVDGSNNPASILEAKVKELGVPVQSIWADGQEREFTFIYSACGCPVKTMVKRTADRTQRTSDLPVMFPDDPAAMVTISRLMRWQG